MSQKNRKNNTIIIDNFELNEKQNSNKNLNFHKNNSYNSGRNKKSINHFLLNYLKKSSSQASINDSYRNKSSFIIQNVLNKNKSIINKKNFPNTIDQKSRKTQRIINLKLNNKQYLKKMLLNPSAFNDRSKNKSKRKSNSLSKNSSISNSKDSNNLSFFNEKKISPIIIRNNNIKKIERKNSVYNKNNKSNRSNSNSYNNRNIIQRNHKNIFKPINIFSKYKNSKKNIGNELYKNSQLLKKYLQEEYDKQEKNKKNTNKSSYLIRNSKANVCKKNLYSNINNKTNDTTVISSGILNIDKTNNHNNSMILNQTVHEINFHVKGVSSSIPKYSRNKKRKIFKGKKIKCMHDLSKTGLSGDDKKVNQDNFFIFKNFVKGLDNIFMGVCDGHGYYGHEVSGYIKENLPMNLNHMIKKQKLNVLKDDLAPIIKKAFISENKSLIRNKQIDSALSGSTCISVIYTPEKLIIANVGDSRAVLGKLIEKNIDKEKLEYYFHKENKKKINKWIAKDLSRDHKPTIHEEAERIIKNGGRIRPMKDEDGEFVGPLRVYMKNKDLPGLAMTRSFGDIFGASAGIIAEPEVSEYYFKEEDKFLILASDGLFEFMSSQEVVDIVKNYYHKNDIVGCCEYLYKESTRLWLEEEDDVIDDITIILVFFEDNYIEC